jgi:hypothetical protein
VAEGSQGRTLTYEEIRRYSEVVAALRETMRLMEAIDKEIEAHGAGHCSVRRESRTWSRPTTSREWQD